MAKKAKSAILPSNKQDPTGVDRLERGAMRDFSKRMKLITKGYIQILNRIPASPAVIVANALSGEALDSMFKNLGDAAPLAGNSANNPAETGAPAADQYFK